MKRTAGSDFDEDGAKWFQSPHYKELKTDASTEEFSQAKEASKRFSSDYEKETKLTRERFYDIFTRITQDGKFKLDIEELNRNLNIRIEEIPDNYKISSTFDELNSKSSVMSRGKKNWSEHETLLCIWLVFAYSALNDRDYNDLSDRDWEIIGRAFPGKDAEQCKVRWQGLLKTNLTKAPWTQEEDKLLTDIIKDKGPKKWKEIACELNKKMESHKTFRQGKQCRERWINHLDPSINRGAWSSDEDLKLLQAHVEIGKKWAEIAKILGNRTENAVKNRWNSLIKKYKGEFGMDIDMFSNSSANSNKSMDDLEKKIAEMVLSKKGKRSDGRTDMLNDQILEVAEEESPTNCSDISIETSITKTEENARMPSRKDDENDMRFNQKKGAMMSVASMGKKKPGSVLAAKNNLRDMVTEEMHTHSHTQSFQQPKSTNGLGGENLFLGQLDQNVDPAQKIYMFERPNGLNNNHQDLMSAQPYNSAPMPLMGQHLSDPRNGMFNMSNDMLGFNMWRNNLNNLNVLNQNAQQQNLSTNFMGLYNDGNLLQQPNYSVSSSTLPNDQHQTKYAASYPSQSYENEHKNPAMKPHEALKEHKSFKLADKTLEQLNVSEAEQSNFYYAVVDVSSGNIYLMDQVTKENYPPPFNQNKFKASLPNPPVNNTMEISGSPALNYTTWASPTLNTNALLNYPLFNNALGSFGFAKAQFSPNLNFYQESPKFDTSFFGSTPKMEGRSNEWTPENMNRPLLSGLGMKQRTGLANSRGDTPPEMKFGTSNGAFLRRINDKGRGLPGAVAEGMKYSSPSSFLQTSQTSHMNRSMLNTGLEKI